MFLMICLKQTDITCPNFLRKSAQLRRRYLTHKAQTKKYLLGVDTGSSKTHALITSINGQALGFGQAGCGNYEVVGLEGFKIAIQSAVNEALHMAGADREDIAAMGFGISGYDWPSEDPIMVEAIQSLGIDCDYRFVNDVTIGLIAGASDGWGIAVDAGTGNNVRGRDQDGRVGRITGNSFWLGEIGGGGEMVWLAQIAVTHAWTQRGPKTRLTQVFMDFAEVDSAFALIEDFTTETIHLPPMLAKEIFRIAEEGDAVAAEIVEISARELALNVNAVIKQLKFQDQNFDLVLIGSTFKAGEQYISPFRRSVQSYAPGANFIQLTLPPVIGSVLLAAEILSIVKQDIRQTLIDSLSNFLAQFQEESDID
jgi:N-acetylglucosamine kinase-like BadF-type ATPase